MNFYLLDAAGAGLVLGFLVIFMLLAIFAEAITLLLLKYNNAGRCFLDALLVNIASLIVGFFIARYNSTGLDMTENSYLDLFLLFLITTVVEFAVLYLLNRKKPVSKTIIAAIAMNLVSYLLLIGIRFIFLS